MLDALLAVALVIIGERVAVPPAQVVSRFEAECVEGRWAPICPALRAEIELSLYGDLQALGAARAAQDRETLRVAATAKFPPLAELGLLWLEKVQSPEDRAAVRIAVEHAAPAVRVLARRQLEAADPDWAKTLGRWSGYSVPGGFQGLVPEPAPEPAELGLPAIEGLRYRHFASRDGRAVYTTRATPDELVGRLGGGQIYTGAELARAQEEADRIEAAGVEEFAAAIVADRELQQIMADINLEQEQIMRTMTANPLIKQIEAAAARGNMRELQALSEELAKQQQAAMEKQEALSKRMEERQKALEERVAAKHRRAMEGLNDRLEVRPVREFDADPAAIRYLPLPAGLRGRPITVAIAADAAFGETVLVVAY